MEAYAQALDALHSALHSMRARGVTASAPVSVLQRLAEGAPMVAPAPATPAAKASPMAAAASAAEPPHTLRGVADRVAAPSAPAGNLPPPPVLPSLPKLPPMAAAPKASRRQEQLAALRAELAASPCEGFLLGVGNPDAELLLVGEAPTPDELKSGDPFSGPNGEMLENIVTKAMAIPREEVYYLFSRPAGERAEAGLATAERCLREQIAIIQPKVIVALGEVALQALVGAGESLPQSRSQWREFQGVPVMVTCHPSHLVANGAKPEKRKFWEDMLAVLRKLGKRVSAKQENFFRV